MTEFNTQKALAMATNRGQCRVAAARRKRFWRACNNAFLAIHIFALAIVGFIVGDGWLFRLVAGSIFIGPLLICLGRARHTSHVGKPTKEGDRFHD